MNKLPFWIKTAEHASLSMLFRTKQHFQRRKNHTQVWQLVGIARLFQLTYTFQARAFQLDRGAV